MKYRNLHRHPQRLPAAGVLLVCLASLAACKAPQAADAPTADTKMSSPVDGAEEAENSCPSQDFSEYLKQFSGKRSVRERYTATPLKYKLYSYVALDGNTDENTPEWTAKEISTPDRLRYFTYRYDNAKGGYIYAGRNGTLLKAELAIQPVQMRVLADGSVEVDMGLESEQDTFTFRRKAGCWYLEQVQDYRS